jgi:Zn-dependent M28 family amino/carboxypeptidase
MCLFLFTAALFPQALKDRADSVSKAEMQAVMEFLAHDLLEGRAPATRGGDLSELYMKSLFKFLGFQPGFNGKYMQPFTLKGFTINSLAVDIGNVSLNHIDDIVGTWVGPEEEFKLEADAVFIGFGVKADIWQWDDFKNTDIKDKFVICRVNDPGMYIDDIFEGKTLTYYGRWIYHIEEAARRGAAGILLIHTDASAGYDWNVVKNSWGGEEVYLQSDLENNLKFRGWIKEESLKRVLVAKGLNLDRMYRRSLSRRFKPEPLNFKVKATGRCTHRDAVNHNVVAVIPGKTDQKIVISAHIDHHGTFGGTEAGQDTIFNGAVDNGSAVAAMMVTAKILKEFQQQLHYTLVVLACQSEEAGMLGSKYYVRSLPPEERAKIIGNINFESTPVWEKTSDFMAVGARFSTFENKLRQLVQDEGLTYSYFSMSNQGFFYRSDQFSFARYNIPAIWISAGENDASGQKRYPNFWKTAYHTVDEEYDPSWPLESMRQTIKMAVLLIGHLNTTKSPPKWKRRLTFPLDQ